MRQKRWELVEENENLILENAKLNLLRKNVKSQMSDIICTLGLNTAHDYDGIESDEDILLYLGAINRKIASVKIQGIIKSIEP